MNKNQIFKHPNYPLTLIKQIMKSPLLAKIKFEPIFFQVLWRFASSLLLQGEAGGRGVWGEFRPSSQSVAKSVRIFSNTHRQLVKAKFGSPSARVRQPFLGAKLNFLSLFRKAERQKRAFLNFNLFELWNTLSTPENQRIARNGRF